MQPQYPVSDEKHNTPGGSKYLRWPVFGERPGTFRHDGDLIDGVSHAQFGRRWNRRLSHVGIDADYNEVHLVDPSPTSGMHRYTRIAR